MHQPDKLKHYSKCYLFIFFEVTWGVVYHCIHWKTARSNYLTLLNCIFILPTAYHRFFFLKMFPSNVSGFKLFQGQDDGAAISRDEIMNEI